MKQLGKLLLIALGLGVFAAALSTIPLAPASASGSAPVTVVNTPLPVQGTVNAVQSGTWNVGVTGTPNVNVANSPTVSIGNTPSVNAAQSGTWNVGVTGNTSGNPLFVRDTDNPAKQPFVSACGIDLTGGSAICLFAAVPAGKELVIEMFTALIHMNIGDRPLRAQLLGIANGNVYEVDYPLSFNGTNPGLADFWVVQQPLTRAYADPGTTPACDVFVSSAEPGQTVNCHMSGYLVNVP